MNSSFITLLSYLKDNPGAGLYATTSGSTGNPKEIYLSRKHLQESALRTIRYFSIDPSWNLHSCISPTYIGGKMMAVRALEAGCSITWEQPTNRPSLTEPLILPENSLIAVVPSQMWHILELLKATKSNNPHINLNKLHFIVGGSAIPNSLRNAISIANIKAWETYGMTETASHIALRRISDEDQWFSPLEGVTLKSDDKDCLIITLSEDNVIATHDIVEFGNEGKFKILGRSDNVIVTGGLKVHPESLESEILNYLPDLSDKVIAITSKPDSKWGEAVILLIEGSLDIISQNSLENMRDKLRYHLKDHELPKEIIFVDKIPLTESGKISRKLLGNFIKML